jgi:tryptophan synthase alpha chain
MPEIPIEEINAKINTEESVQKLAKKYGIDLIFLVSTNTPKNRREKIFKISSGFIYAVSSPTITGSKVDLKKETTEMLNLIKKETEIPICVGFGVSSPEDIRILKKAGTDGAIIGSKIIKLYQEEQKKSNHQTALQKISNFCQKCQDQTNC